MSFFEKNKNFFSKKKIIIFLFCLALISGLFWSHCFFFDRNPRPGGDELVYDGVATDLLTSYTYTDRGNDTYVEPVYPIFIAGIYSIFGHNAVAVKSVQLLIFGLTVVLIYLLGRKLFGEKVGRISGFLSALFYGFANHTGTLLRENLLIFLTLILVYLLYRAYEERKALLFFGAGIILGLITLTNAIVELLPPFILLNFFFLLRNKVSLGQVVFRLSIFLIGFLVILSPWVIRNKVEQTNQGIAIVPRAGEMLTVRATLMEDLYPNIHKYILGHFLGYYFAEKIYPDFDVRAFRDFKSFGEIRDGLMKQGYSRNDIDKILTKGSVRKIITQPHKYLLISFLDFLSFNNPIIPQRIFGGNESAYLTFAEGRWPQTPEFIKAGLLLLLRFVWLTLFFFIIYAVILNWRNWPKVGWLVLIILYFNMAYSAIFAVSRYALPIYPFYIILAVVGFSAVLSKLCWRDSFHNSSCEKQT